MSKLSLMAKDRHRGTNERANVRAAGTLNSLALPLPPLPSKLNSLAARPGGRTDIPNGQRIGHTKAADRREEGESREIEVAEVT